MGTSYQTWHSAWHLLLELYIVLLKLYRKALDGKGMDELSWFDYIKLSPQKKWDYRGLSGNPNITWDIVLANPDKAWNYDALSRNPNITWDIVLANPDKAWNYAALSENLSITWDIP